MRDVDVDIPRFDDLGSRKRKCGVGYPGFDLPLLLPTYFRLRLVPYLDQFMFIRL